jgi:thiol-disulfide isomerase/thioredoxin
MKRDWKPVLLAAVMVAACSRETPQSQGGSDPRVGWKRGAQVPKFEAVTLDGKPFRLPDSEGRVLLVNIWATWCGPCRYEIPELKKLQQQHAGKKFDVVGVSVDTSGEAAVRDFVRQHQINYPVVLDPEGSVAAMMKTTVLPTSALVDRTGKVLWVKVGVVRSGNSDLAAALKEAL